MPAALPADWSAIAVMAAQGQTLQSISDATGIAMGTLQARSAREGWKAQRKPITEEKVRHAVSNGQMQQSATNGLDIAANALAEDERETRASLSRSARRLARQSETADIAIETPADVLAVAKLYAVTHRIDQESGKTGPASVVNLAILLDGCPLPGRVIDAVDAG